MTDEVKENLKEEKSTKEDEVIKTQKTEKSAKSKADKETELKEKIENLQDSLLRSAAEFDNFRKRTQKERAMLYNEIKVSVVEGFLPCIDSIEAMASLESESSNDMKKGVDLIYLQLLKTLENLGVEAIPAVGEKFDPELHDAVMHVQDDKYEAGIIVEELQRGYKIDKRIIRHSMVKVAN